MPICGKTEPPPSSQLYFKSLKDFDAWSPGNPDNYDGTKFKSRKLDAKSVGKGKLLVCHDYKGGYVENSFARSYTFNFWSSSDIFVYFSHHRVTIPPPGWVSAAHRQGVKILGTLIFEEGGEEDSLRLIVGKIPSSKTGQVGQAAFTLPLSPYYAKLLAELARERGFDGYLLNFECRLGGSLEQTRALSAWITLLQSEILDKVGPHGETIWYDSVIINGELAWQDRLDSYNLPFFLSSTGLFSNYTWRNNYPSLSAQYFMTLDSKLIGNTVEIGLPKTLQQTYMGIDVWGRGSHGGGGFGVFRALEHISPDSLGLSVALFGQAWTWESEQDKDGWSWDKWWEYDTKLWVGSSSGTLGVQLPVLKMKRDEPPCTHGDFVPIKSFFSCHAPPDPADLRFHTTFCPGTGLNWFVEGNKVYDSVDGWTDIDKQTSVGDMLWPRPELFWEDERMDRIPTALTTFCMDDAWNGGNSLRISISSPGSEEETAAYRSLWLPVQSLSITPGKLYQASVIYKLDPLADGLDIEVALSPHAAPGAEEDLIINTISSTTQDLAHGWTTLAIQFSISAIGDNDGSPPSTACIGIAIAILTETPTEPLQLSFLLGQLNVSASVPPSFKEDKALILWADYKPSSNPAGETLSGTLSWEVASTFPLTTSIKIPSLEDPISVWNPQPIGWFPSFLYFNIYAQPFVDPYNAGKVDDAVWIGTSGAGWDGRKKAFTVLQVNLPFKISGKTRFYVQGVTDYGEVMTWERCAFVDVSL